MTADHSEFILEMDNISKGFPGVKALDHVSFRVKRGKVQALVGENGAGKSTLLKILSGVYQKDDGEITFNGQKIDSLTPRLSQEIGIAIIYQELNLVPDLSIAENIFLGRLPKRFRFFVDWPLLHREASKLLAQEGFNIDPRTPVREIGIGLQQMVEIAKALSMDAKLILMDEPTFALTEQEEAKLFDIIRSLRERGVSMVYISHKLDEIFEVCDTATVIRDGKVIDSSHVAETSRDEIIQMMVGRKIDQLFPKEDAPTGEVLLKVEGLTRTGVIDNINLEVREGEIVGIAGLMGAGRTELARAIFGVDPIGSGKIFVGGKEVDIR